MRTGHGTRFYPSRHTALAAGALLLFFIGIHNAWDVVTFIITDDMPQRRD
jgi:hypothetical protein